ncbi:embryonic polyadenylate-binding protein A-like [Erpetoichthys calabaricus]|uniref:embryonic polyadenylate-binding protein A-like n=1 Tax=Erpetoichthys calabaricus TaxID=27687 RepID=UPI0022344170|nr:embryonic polyadenylate-binding protein A-like [Erpetoichthys calabaricus]
MSLSGQSSSLSDDKPEIAPDGLNFNTISGQPLQSVGPQQDYSSCKAGRICIGNLEKSVTTDDIHNIFSAFGKILSCRVFADEHGSRGYGYVHFESREAEEKAVQKLNGMLLNGQKVIIGHYLSSRERDPNNKPLELDRSENKENTAKNAAVKQPEAEPGAETMNFNVIKGKPTQSVSPQHEVLLNNCKAGKICIGNLEKSIDSKDIYNTFSAFGNILSCRVFADENGSRGFGYVHFEDQEAAQKAVQKLNGMLFNDQKVVIGHYL